jgi:hypothetical protein
MIWPAKPSMLCLITRLAFSGGFMEHPYQVPSMNSGLSAYLAFWLRSILLIVIYGIPASGLIILSWLVWGSINFKRFSWIEIPLLLIKMPTSFHIFFISLGSSLPLFVAGLTCDWYSVYKRKFNPKPNMSWKFYFASWLLLLIAIGTTKFVLDEIL